MQALVVPALETSLRALVGIAEAAYAPYVKRIGRRPAPMDADFAGHLVRQEVRVAQKGDIIQGFIISYTRRDDQFIENIAVDPKLQGKGIGRSLLLDACAQARENNKDYVRLYTNEKMTESLKTYLKFGFVETERKLEDGFNRVFMEMRIGS